jgi:hypothetical protein
VFVRVRAASLIFLCAYVQAVASFNSYWGSVCTAEKLAAIVCDGKAFIQHQICAAHALQLVVQEGWAVPEIDAGTTLLPPRSASAFICAHGARALVRTAMAIIQSVHKLTKHSIKCARYIARAQLRDAMQPGGGLPSLEDIQPVQLRGSVKTRWWSSLGACLLRLLDTRIAALPTPLTYFCRSDVPQRAQNWQVCLVARTEGV